MTCQAYIALYHNLSEHPASYRVAVTRRDPATESSPNHLHLSFSPIFAVADNPFLPVEGKPYGILFVVHEHPFVQLGTLPQSANKHFWFSLGITSLVAILPDQQLFPTILGHLDADHVLCTEMWCVDANGLVNPEVTQGQSRGGQVLRTMPKVVPTNRDVSRVFREISVNVDSITKRAELLMPSLLPGMEEILREVHKEADDIVKEEADVLGEAGVAGSSADNDTKGNEESIIRRLAHYKHLNVSLNDLIQVNSGLAYVLSQGFYGGPPLARNLSLHSCHSLLGVGTALRAIQSLTDFVVEGFARYPIAKAIERYADPSVARFLAPDDNDKNARKTADAYLKDVGRKSQTPKLAYFSTRMGFSEHSYCVTAASHSLSAADTLQRNLLTLTHELLHSHVKGLFGKILTGKDTTSLLALAQEHKNGWLESNAGARRQSDWTVLRFLRYRIFAFCDAMDKLRTEYPFYMDVGARAGAINVGPLEDDRAELERLRYWYPYLSELVVHILDLDYFYYRNERIYLSTLWTSWSTVPGVADDVERYILRCLTAISVTNIPGLCEEEFPEIAKPSEGYEHDLSKRFSNSVNALVGILEEIEAAGKGGPLIKVVLNELQDDRVVKWLRRAFFPCHMFAQVTKQFLYSPNLRNYFDSFADPLADSDAEGQPVYKIDSREFIKDPIRNPIAFLRDRLLRGISDDRPCDDEEARSAWLFLALSSISN